MNGIYTIGDLMRITINKNIGEVGNSRINEVKFIKYPPAHVVKKYGRCNTIGQSVFYGTFFKLTAVKEMKPRIGDLLTVSHWRLKENQTFTACPIFFIASNNEGVYNEFSNECLMAHEKAIAGFSENEKKWQI